MKKIKKLVVLILIITFVVSYFAYNIYAYTQQANSDAAEETVNIGGESDEETNNQENAGGEVSLFSSSTINIENFNGEDYPEMAYFDGAAQPFTADTFVNSKVNTFTGNLEVRQVDLALEGKHGLNFELARVYNSTRSNESDIKEVSSSASTDPTFLQRYAPYVDIGMGWEWDIPYIEVIRSSTGGVKSKWLHFGSRGTWKCYARSASGLYKYPYQDIKLKDGIDNTILTEKDGTEYLFSSTDKSNIGKLQSITNRFGDKISFNYSSDSEKNKWVKITDTVGRVITITEYNDSVQVTVTSPVDEDKLFYYDVSSEKVGNYKRKTLYAATDSGNNTTFYNYEPQTLDYKTSTGIVIGRTRCHLLTDIDMPTGASEHYEYDAVNSSTSSIKTSSGRKYRKTFITVASSCKYNKNEYNNVTKTVNIDKTVENINSAEKKEYSIVTRYLDRTGTSATERSFVRAGESDTQFSCMAVNSDKRTEIYEYNSNGTIRRQTIAPPTDLSIALSGFYQRDEYTYPKISDISALYPESKITYIRNAGSKSEITIHEKYSYDKYADLLEYSDDRSGEYLTTEYLYDQTYHLPTMKKYKQNSEKTIVERSILTEDKKNIGETAVYESISDGAETLKQKTAYDYDADGLLKTQTAYLVDDSGALTAENVISYDYTDNRGRSGFNGLRATTQTAVNRRSVDENSMQIKSGSQSLAAKMYYDDYDNLIKQIDPNGNVTQYKYTPDNKLSKVINPDGTSKSYEYIINTGENRIIQTDENGNKRELMYDVYGNLRHEKDINNGKLLVTYEYNRDGKLVSAFDYVNSKSTYYSYDKDSGDLINVDSWEEKAWFAEQAPSYVVNNDAPEPIDKQKYTYWDVKAGDNRVSQKLTFAHEINIFENLLYPITVEADDYIFVKTSGITSKYYLEISFKINGEWQDKAWIIKDKDSNGISAVSASELGIAGQTVEGIKFYGHKEKGSIDGTYIYKIGSFKGTDAPKKLQSIKYDYDYANQSKYLKVTRTVEGDTAEEYSKTSVYADMSGNTVKKEEFLSDSSKYVTQYKYDNVGNVVEEKSPRAVAERWQNPSAEYEYDYAGRCISVKNADGNTAQTTYDSLGRTLSQTDFLGNKTTYEYDNLGRLLKQTAPIDGSFCSETFYSYDNNGNLTDTWTSSQKEGGAKTYHKASSEYNSRNMPVKNAVYVSEAQANYTQYAYDGAGNAVRMYTGLSSPLTISGIDNVSGASDYSVVKNEYDYLNRLVKTTDALGQSETYVPNYSGGVDKKTDRNGNITENTYDAMARPLKTQAKTPDGSVDAHDYTYDAIGRAKTVDNVTYEYDNLGRVISETEGNTVKAYTYDEEGNRKSFKLTVNSAVQMWLGYEYTKMNLLDKVTNLSDNSIIEQYDYDANGNLITKYAPAAKLRTQYEYNAAGQIKKMSVTAQNGLIPVGTYEYSYYADGNQQQKKETANGTGEKLTQYDYDGAGRLIQEQTSDKTMSYQYDASGNRSALNVSSGESYSYVYDKNNRLKSESKTIAGTIEKINYFYDPNGNTISKMSQTYGEPKAKASVSMGNISGGSGLYTYNGFNQLTEAFENGKITSYTYDANGLRKSKTIDDVTTNHIWDGSNIVAETNSAGAVTSKYYRGTQLIASEQNSSKRYYANNAHGDVTALIDSAGSITKTYTYDAFGVEENIDENDTNPFRYCGEYYDAEINSIYLRARYYQPTIGRFTTEDPIKDGLNWYVYCSGNPVVLIDPSGLGAAPVRNLVESNGGEVIWNAKDASATVKINGYTETFFSGDSYGTFINSDGKMYTDDLHLENLVYAPSDYRVAYYYNRIGDDFGKFVFRTWFNGDGSAQVVDSWRWNGFIRDNKYVRERLAWLIPQSIAEGKNTIYNVSNTNLSGGEGGYESGEQLINGANMSVGGFLITGQIYNNRGIFNIDIQYAFNDVIDSNDDYASDQFFSWAAKKMGFNGKDYNLTIKGGFSVTYTWEGGVKY